MWRVGLGDHELPHRLFQVDILPDGFPQFRWPNEDERRKPKRAAYRKRPLVTVNRTEDFRGATWICYRREVRALDRRQSAPQVACRILCCTACGDRVAKYLSAILQSAMRRIQGPAFLDEANYLQDLRRSLMLPPTCWMSKELAAPDKTPEA